MPRVGVRTRRGFTLIELMVVIGIISLLATFLMLGFGGLRKRAAIRATRALILQLEQGCEKFKQAYGFDPPDGTGSTGTSGSWVPGEPPPWGDDERCIFVSDAGVQSSELYIGMLEFIGLANPTDTVEPVEALAFCLLLEKKGGPFVELEQRLLTNADNDTYQPYMDTRGSSASDPPDGRWQDVNEENLGSPKRLLEIVDAWGTPLQYRSPAGRNQDALELLADPTSVLIISAGPNGEFGWDATDLDAPVELDEDDIVNGQPE